VNWSEGKYPHKYMVTLSDGSHVSFGNREYQQYRDKTPLKLYSNLDHNDKKRRRNYRKRHMGVKLKDGTPAYQVKYSPSWLSLRYLW
jgi:hypothetical protein